MRKKRFFSVALVVIFLLLGFCLAFAEQKTVTLPKGTKVEKLGSGHFRFRLPNGCLEGSNVTISLVTREKPFMMCSCFLIF